jgi:hypothetical protein
MRLRWMRQYLRSLIQRAQRFVKGLSMISGVNPKWGNLEK